MPETNIELRFAHSEGYTSLCYDDTGRHLLTCGTDGDFRIWNGLADEDPASHHVGECAYSIAFKDGKVYVSNDTNKVEVFSFPEGASEGMATRFTSIINHIQTSLNGPYLASGAADFMVKVTNLNDCSEKVFNGHDAPLLSVAVDPKNELLASSSCDGTVRVWSLESTEALKTWSLLPKSNDFSNSKSLGRISWHPHNGKCLAVPVDKEIQIYERYTWTKNRTLADVYLDEVISIASFSPCGTYLLAVCTNGKLLVWHFEKGTVLKCEQHENKLTITDTAWHPTSKEIAFADMQGQIGVFKYEDGKKTQDKQLEIDDLLDLSADEDDDIDLDMVKASSLIDDEAESDGEVQQTSSKPKSRISKIVDDDDDNSTGIDIGKIKAAYEPAIFGNLDENSSLGKEKAAVPEPPKTVIVEKVMANIQQEAFQPSSTPVHFQHRYMLWNNVGLIRCYNTEEESSIDVEFHDINVHHAIHIQNIMGHTMAALSEEALVLAGPGEDEQPSKLVCMHFGTWDSSKEWNCDMPEGETILSVSTGRGWVCVVTDKRYLRLYTVGGLQLNVISLPGPVVCTAGMENALIVVYHQSAGLTDEQHLSVLKFTVQKTGISASQPFPFPLSMQSTVSWFGFTDEGTVCSVDSIGVVRLSTLKAGSFWSPVASLEERNKGKSDHYFVIGLSEIQQELRCILCKGSHYPATLPRPTLSVVPFQMPFCELNTDKGDNEEKLCRQIMLKSLLDKLLKDDFQVENELDVCKKKTIDFLLKVFALSTNGNREFRAMEVAERMPSSTVVQGAIRYATMKKCLALAQRLGEVAHAKEQEEMQAFIHDVESEEEQMEDPVVVPLKPRLSFLNNPSEESIIQPKQMTGKVKRTSNSLNLYRNENSIETEDTSSRENVCEENDEDAGSIPDTPSQLKKNPFKVSSQKKQSGSSLDAVLRDSLEAKSVKVTPQPVKKIATKKKVTQNGISPETKSAAKASSSSKKSSAFQLYLAEVKETLTEEFPELDEADIVKKAVADFKNLNDDDKQLWHDKAQSSSNPSEESTKKRKANENSLPEDGKNKKAKPASKNISDNTSSKIMQFMFKKN